jgi:hypothetical protein
MGLSWQRGALSPVAAGRFLVLELLRKRLLYGEPLCRPMRVRFGGTWMADIDGVQLHLEPGLLALPHGPDRDLDVVDVPPPKGAPG